MDLWLFKILGKTQRKKMTLNKMFICLYISLSILSANKNSTLKFLTIIMCYFIHKNTRKCELSTLVGWMNHLDQLYDLSISNLFAANLMGYTDSFMRSLFTPLFFL